MKFFNSERHARGVGILIVLCAMLIGLLLPGVVSAAPSVAAAGAPQASGVYHTVVPGNTLSGLARYYGTTVQAIMQANGLSSTTIYVGQVLYIPTGGGSGGGGGGGGSCSQYYYVQPGDTLSGIARWFGVSVSALAQCNGITNPSRIYVGQRLCIPSGYYPPQPYPPQPYPPQPYPPQPYPPHQTCGQYYVVQQGDNLSRIAARCGTTTQQLVYLNGLSHPSLIYPGQVLRMY